MLSFGRAVTPGDALLFLPEERIVVTGDLLIEPVTYAHGVYPEEWLDALERLDALDAAVLVPGHGAAMHDEEHLHETMEAMRILPREGASAKGRGLDVDEARRMLMPQLAGVRRRITDGDPAVEEQFEALFVDWYLHRVWEELDGFLSDVIAPIPHG